MSKPEYDKDGFRIVNSKRKSKHKPTRIPNINQFQDIQNIHIDIEKSVRKINSAVEDLRSSIYLDVLLQNVSSILNSGKLVEILCLGLGHIGDCNISRYQLGLLLCLKDHYKPLKVLVHDPIFSKDECSILQQYGLEIIEKNCEGCYIISEEGVSLFFFPHCPKQLTNNFLWSNWSTSLRNCILICNSFTSLFENQPDRLILESVPYIYKIHPHTKEIIEKNNFKYTDIFNDTSIHTFPHENLEKLDPSFWVNEPKTEYKDTEEFITSLMVEKLNI